MALKIRTRICRLAFFFILPMVMFPSCEKKQTSQVKGDLDSSLPNSSTSDELEPGKKRKFEDLVSDTLVSEDKEILEEEENDVRTAQKSAGIETQGLFVPLPSTLVALDSDRGIELMDSADAKRDFFSLVRTIEAQINGRFCNVATAVAVLNALHHDGGVPVPVPGKSKKMRANLKFLNGFGAWTQTNIFEYSDAEEVRDPLGILNHGMDLQMFGRFLRKLPLEVKVTHADQLSFEEFKTKVVGNLNARGNFVVVNYHRTPLGQPIGAHYSPVGAYNSKEKMFLVMDVARYKFPYYWVPEALLWEALNTQDSDLALPNRFRGFVEVSPGLIGQ